jgi:secreted trypsin-like serine protease
MVENRIRKLARWLAVAGVVAGAGAVGLPNAWAIYGGENATQAYPFMASVQFKPDQGLQHWCGGTVIDREWVVTARHCTGELPFGGPGAGLPQPSDLMVRVASNDWTAGGDLVEVAKIVVHGDPIDPDPTAGDQISGNDIALLRLSRPVPVTPVAIATAPPAANAPVRLLGWGLNCKAPRPSSDCHELPKSLRQLDTTVLDRSGCISTGTNRSINDREICQSPTASGENARAHDSGGPMLQEVSGRWVLVGALSGPVSQSLTADGPNLYTDVTAYVAWISQQMSLQ